MNETFTHRFRTGGAELTQRVDGERLRPSWTLEDACVSPLLAPEVEIRELVGCRTWQESSAASAKSLANV